MGFICMIYSPLLDLLAQLVFFPSLLSFLLILAKIRRGPGSRGGPGPGPSPRSATGSNYLPTRLVRVFFAESEVNIGEYTPRPAKSCVHARMQP